VRWTVLKQADDLVGYCTSYPATGYTCVHLSNGAVDIGRLVLTGFEIHCPFLQLPNSGVPGHSYISSTSFQLRIG
jgi:hypothetical protein